MTETNRSTSNDHAEDHDAAVAFVVATLWSEIKPKHRWRAIEAITDRIAHHERFRGVQLPENVIGLHCRRDGGQITRDEASARAANLARANAIRAVAAEILP